MNELLKKIDNEQEIYKTKKIGEMQKELNSVLLKIKTPDIPNARHSMIEKQTRMSCIRNGESVNYGSQGKMREAQVPFKNGNRTLQSSMFSKFKIQENSEEHHFLETDCDD